MRLIHSADWQIGAAFPRFGAAGERVAKARLQTLEKTVRLAEEYQADLLLIAGDLFEDTLVGPEWTVPVYECLNASKVPVWILPGNHDPAAGPGTVWTREPFTRLAPHIKILTEPGPHPLGSAFILAAPLRQRSGREDPTLIFQELSRTLPPDAIKIGVAHGSPAVPGQHQPDDWPIALNAATRADLDYLALGHWHSYREFDSGRMVMCGTPEPDDFGQLDAGSVVLVEIDRHGGPVYKERLQVQTLRWQELILSCDVVREPALVETLGPKSVVRIRLQGTLTASGRVLIERFETELRARCAAFELIDETSPSLLEIEEQDLHQTSPILAAVLGELKAIEPTGSTSKAVPRLLTHVVRELRFQNTEELIQAARGACELLTELLQRR